MENGYRYKPAKIRFIAQTRALSTKSAKNTKNTKNLAGNEKRGFYSGAEDHGDFA